MRLLASLIVAAAVPVAAQAVELGPIDLHAQATYIRQLQPSFPAAYSGTNSLLPQRALSWSFTTTLFLGADLGRGWEAYFNPEAAAGVPFSGLHGLGGLSNGEIARTSGPALTAYTARGFIRKTWNLGGTWENEASAANQVAAAYAADRIVLTAGKLSVLDVFDTVEYSRDARTQFMNWASLTYGAWDYPADARGYTWGVALEYVTDRFAVRGGQFAVPRESNGLSLDPQFFSRYGQVVELEVPYALGAQTGILRLMGFRNRAVMGSFDNALALGRATDSTPSVADVRTMAVKVGLGVGVQHAFTDQIGAYLRAGWNDGKTETYMFTEIDRSVAAGVLVRGDAWSRPRDTLGVAGYVNMLGQPHRDYLAAGGLGFFLGDGALDYKSERIGEVFYSMEVARGIAVTGTWQYIENPGYNRVRGPVNFFGFRLHAEI
jgi:hypothetical protein